jgi:uncharacterized protein YecE (DUF72 family)
MPRHSGCSPATRTSPKVLPPDLREALPALDKANLYFKDLPGELRDALWERFKAALEPLRASAKLGMVHFQFAPWVIRNRDGMAHVRHCVEVMRDYTVSVEFRNKTWFDEAHLEATLAFERELNVVHHRVRRAAGLRQHDPVGVGVDAPELLARAPARAQSRDVEHQGREVGGRAFQLRLRGGGTGRDRRQGRAPRTGTFTTHVIMNNNFEDQGQRNAATLVQILADRRKALVPHLQLPLERPEEVEEGEWVEAPS